MNKLITLLKSIRFEKGLIGISITTILTVELAVNCVSMAILAPGHVERIGFVAMALVIVFLGLPAYLIGKRGLWVCFVVLAVFLNTSFIVESLRVQSAKANPELDYEVKRLDGLITQAMTDEADLQRQYQEATQAANMDNLDGQIKSKQTERQVNEALRRGRIAEVTSNPVIKGSDVFVAIPRSTGLLSQETITKMSGPIQLAFFLLLFISSQLALVAFTKKGKEQPVIKDSLITQPRRRISKATSTPLDADIARWVGGTWAYARPTANNPPRSPRGAIVPKSSFFKQVKNFPEPLYDELMTKAISLGLIVDGLVTERDTEKVIVKISEDFS